MNAAGNISKKMPATTYIHRGMRMEPIRVVITSPVNPFQIRTRPKMPSVPIATRPLK